MKKDVRQSSLIIRAMAEDGSKDDDGAAAKERAAAEEAAKWQQMALRMQQQRAGTVSAPAAKSSPDADAAKSSLGTSDLSALEGTVGCDVPCAEAAVSDPLRPRLATPQPPPPPNSTPYTNTLQAALIPNRRLASAAPPH
jgi:hypothetical protein